MHDEEAQPRFQGDQAVSVSWREGDAHRSRSRGRLAARGPGAAARAPRPVVQAWVSETQLAGSGRARRTKELRAAVALLLLADLPGRSGQCRQRSEEAAVTCVLPWNRPLTSPT